MITRMIYPFHLRTKISWRFRKLISDRHAKDVPLQFNKKIRLDLMKDDIGHQSIILNGFYELELTKAIRKLAKTGGLLVDVGANYGYFSCLWAGENKNNRAIAFEASPLNVSPLQNNISKNGFSGRINVEPVALGKEIGNAKFDTSNVEGQTGWGSLVLEDSDGAIDVAINTLDNYADEYAIKEIDVLKIDVEGADTWVLKGASKLIREKRIKNIFYEANPVKMEEIEIDPDEAEAFLINNGYVVKELSNGEYYAYPQ